VPTLQHIPKACRNVFSGVVEKALNQVIADPKSTKAWFNLLAIPKLTLAKPKRGGWEHRNQNSKLVKERLKRIEDPINHPGLWEEACKASKFSKGSRSSTSAEDFKLKQVINFAQDGRYGKAAKTLASNGLAQPSAKVCDHLESLHPQAPIPDIPSDPLPQATVISEEQMVGAPFSSFRASFFKEAAFCPSPAQAA
jgi:hypothetical protein